MEIESIRSGDSEEGEQMEGVDDKPELYDEIYKCYKQKLYRDCLALLDEVTEDHVGYQILKSACMIHLGEKVSEAHRILDEVLLRCPENEFTIYAKGLAYYHEELWEDAAKCFAQAREMNDTSEMERAEVMLGKAQEKLKASGGGDEGLLEVKVTSDKPKIVLYPGYKRSMMLSKARVPRRFGCEKCNHFFGKKFNLDRHNRSIHNRETPRNYPRAPLSETVKSSPKIVKPKEPVAEAEKEAPPIEKEIIKPVKTRSTFGSGKKKVKCKVCNKVFKKSSIARHEVTHTGFKAHPCGQCPMAFHQKSDLQRHEATHSTELAHECELCGRRFRIKKNLQVHKRRHH